MADNKQSTDEGGELTAADNIEMTVKALIASIPYIGSALSIAIFERMERKRQKRVEEFIEAWSATLKEHAEKIDNTYFDTDEFEGVFRRTMHKVQAEPDQAKQFLAHNLLARNTIEGDPASYDFDSYVLELISVLTPLHFECLFVLAQTPERSGATRMGHFADAGFHLTSQVAEAVGRRDQDVEPVMSHLVSLGLCRGTMGLHTIGGVQSPASLAYGLADAGRSVLLRVQQVRDKTVKAPEKAGKVDTAAKSGDTDQSPNDDAA